MSTANTTTVYSYVRWSRPEQAKGDSYRRQIEATEKYCSDHGYTLSTRSLRDRGVSAFRGKNARTGALAEFLQAIEQGEIPADSILSIENLDRLSREEVVPALTLLLRILGSGVRVYTTMDGKEHSIQEYNKNPWGLMASISVMVRANEESATKSKRLKESWQTKRTKAKHEGKPLSNKCPGWMHLNRATGRYELIPDRVKTVRQIVQWTLDGHGTWWITGELNRLGIKTFNRGLQWSAPTVRYIQHSKTLIGEYQPKQLKPNTETREVIPAGDPVPDFYPAAISKADFYAMQAGIRSRKNALSDKGGKNGNHTNLFGTLLRWKDFNDSTSTARTRSIGPKRKRIKYLYPYGNRVRACAYLSIQIEPYEAAFFEWVLEINGSLTHRPNRSNRLAELRAKFEELSEKLTKINARILEADGQQFDSLLTLVTAVEAQRKATKAEMEEEQAKASDKGVSATQLAELIHQMQAGRMTDAERIELRGKLKAAIAAAVERIDLRIFRQGLTKVALSTVFLRNGSQRLFAVRYHRDDQPETYSDAHLWTPGLFEQFPASFAKALGATMLKAKTPEGMRKAWDDLIAFNAGFEPVAPPMPKGKTKRRAIAS